MESAMINQNNLKLYYACKEYFRLQRLAIESGDKHYTELMREQEDRIKKIVDDLDNDLFAEFHRVSPY